MRRLLALSALALLLPACSLLDDGLTTVRGRVVDADTREPVPARIVFTRKTGPLLGALTTVETGADGRFTAEFEDVSSVASIALTVDPLETADTPPSANLAFYGGANRQDIRAGDLGDLEVHAVSRAVVRTSRLLTADETMSLSVTATRSEQGAEREVTSDVRDFPGEAVRSDVVWAGTRVLVRWQLRTLGGAPLGSGQTETVAPRGASTDLVLGLP